jgi:uncharacterized Tic20 family protein
MNDPMQQPQAFGEPPAPAAQPAAGLDKNEMMWALIAHLSYFVLSIIGPVIVLVAHENIIGKKSRFVAHHAKQALFWQVGALVVGLLTCGIAALIMMVWAVLAALAANQGEWYTYPLLQNVTAD